LSKKISIGLALLCIPLVASANLTWPALYVSEGIRAWWVIAAGLVVEWVAIKWLFRLSIWRTTLVDVAANAVSALLGLVLIPVAGIVYEYVLGSILHWAFSWNTFSHVGWVVNAVLAATVNVAIELLVMRSLFKLPLSRRAKWVLFAANLVTALMALAPATQAFKRDY
jgi:hypothetical protein